MAHSPTRDSLAGLASASAGDPTGFLEGLSDIHDDWHSEFTRTYGFLLFHARVVRYFTQIVGPVLNPPITAYTAPDLQNMNVQPFQFNVAAVDTLSELASLSSAIEGWHNTAHTRIGSATGAPMIDPRQNIYFRPFWRLHFYIEDVFQAALAQYASRNHPGDFLTPMAVASHIEVAHHGWVPRISVPRTLRARWGGDASTRPVLGSVAQR